MGAVVEIQIMNKNIKSIGHLVDHICEAKTHTGEGIRRHNPLGGDRPIWRVELGKALTDMLASDIWITYDPFPISLMRHGISQAITRHVLSHKNVPRGGWHMDVLIQAVSGDLTNQQMRDRRRELRSDSSNLEGFGIRLLDDDRVQWARVNNPSTRGANARKRGANA